MIDFRKMSRPFVEPSEGNVGPSCISGANLRPSWGQDRLSLGLLGAQIGYLQPHSTHNTEISNTTQTCDNKHDFKSFVCGAVFQDNSALVGRCRRAWANVGPALGQDGHKIPKMEPRCPYFRDVPRVLAFLGSELLGGRRQRHRPLGRRIRRIRKTRKTWD
jgi:hypothetical protein